MKENGFVAFYDKHKISPVSQDISDLDRHVGRRRKLYRMLGIDYRLFRGAEILEVGAGSGYNALVFLLMGARMDIVEPNPTGRAEMEKLFSEYGINPSQYTIYDCVVEEFQVIKQYDFVIAEGFLPIFSRDQRQKILKRLFQCVKTNGYLVITTICEFSYFFEYLRVILGLILTREIKEFDSQVSVLSAAFSSHLKSLKFASRPIEDWVKDSILNPVGDLLSFTIADSIKELSLVCRNIADFEVISTSPCLVSNLSWYKDLDYLYSDIILREFDKKRHLLLCTKFTDGLRDREKNQRLAIRLALLREYIRLYRGGAIITTLC